MKKATLIAASVAALAVSPAFAQQAWWGAPAPYASTPYAHAPQARAQVVQQGAFAQSGVIAGEGYAAIGTPAYGQAVSPDVAVSVDGIIVGQDPDPNIRASLQRDADMILGRSPG